MKSYTLGLTNNNDYKARYFSFAFSSLKSPTTVFSQNLYSKKKKKIWNQKVLNHKENKYETKRITIVARDKTKSSYFSYL